jgi:hypothetical protein
MLAAVIKRLSDLNLAARVVIGVGFAVVLLAAYGGWQLVAWLSARGNDTWVFESTNGWTDRSTGPAPSIRTDAAMAYDPARRVLVLFGGRSQSAPDSLDDTWTWDAGGWHIQGQTPHPPGLAGAAMAYDPLGRRLILFGGLRSQQAQTASSPPAGCQVTISGGAKVPPPSACYVTPSAALQAGTSLEASETWAYSNGQWTKLAPAHQPPPREGSALAFDALSRGMILFGGSTQPQAQGGQGDILGDTWAFEGGDWSLLAPGMAPPPRAYASFADSPAGPLLFGGTAGGALAGAGAGQALGDTWRWDGSTWQRLTPAHSPDARYSAAMASPRPAGSLVLFGGQLGCGADHATRGCSVTPYLDDTWSWDGHDWRSVDRGFLAAKPRARADASMAYFGATGVFVLFGGQDPHLLSLF